MLLTTVKLQPNYNTTFPSFRVQYCLSVMSRKLEALKVDNVERQYSYILGVDLSLSVEVGVNACVTSPKNICV